MLDIDGTLTAAGSSAVPAWIIQAVSRLKEHNQVYLFSNKNMPERNMRVSVLLGVPLIDSPHAKPNPKVLAGLPGGAVVVGDKYLTDGLLAHFTGAEFVKVTRITAASEPFADKLLSAIDDVAGVMWHLFVAMRPGQWIKNALVFVPLFFAQELFNPIAASAAAAAFGAFCLIASATYLFNDLVDKEADRAHPTKRHRPVAAGTIAPWSAALLAVLLVGAGMLLLWLRAPQALGVLAAYLVSSVVYSVYLKRLPVAEMLVFVWFYFARMLAGALAAGVVLSAWFTLSVVFLALFLITAKRYCEHASGRSRAVLARYSPEFLQGMLYISAALVVAFYALYTVLGSRESLSIYSVIPVLGGIMRYLQLTLHSAAAEEPERLVVSDPGLLLAGASWLVLMGAVFYG